MSKNIAIKVEKLSKLYRLGELGTGSLGHDINRFWAKTRGKEDPYSVIGQTNDRTASAKSDYVWALKDINFEVEKGEVLGIIGKNGAGKSTLLKLISQITSPTEGSIKAKGRIASLLEVGTGMHPEMTARENIFLNGAILGMNKKEIKSKFDEIIDFAGCQLYVDTPLKRFSSGMRVRLGFAVAAFLEPEILIVDEVLAVGDAEFQKKAIGKMKEVSEGGGRTVLFVSHNMASVRNLCNKGIILENGMLTFSGNVNDVVDYYLNKEFEGISSTGEYIHQSDLKSDFQLNHVQLFNAKNELTALFLSEEIITVNVNYTLHQTCRELRISIKVLTHNDIVVFTASSQSSDTTNKTPGTYCAKLFMPANFFNQGNYNIEMNVGIPKVKALLSPIKVLDFNVEKLTPSGSSVRQHFKGVTAPLLDWEIEKVKNYNK